VELYSNFSFLFSSSFDFSELSEFSEEFEEEGEDEDEEEDDEDY